MTRNDKYFKILFAIEIALVPMVFFANLLLETWAVSLFVCAILLAKIWLELFKDRLSFTHVVIDAIGSVIVFVPLIILFINKDVLPTALGVWSIVLIVAYNVMSIFMFKRALTEFIEAIDYCYALFECLTLCAFVFILYYNLIAYIGLIAIIITTAVSILYKVYYIFRYTSANRIFRKKNK